MNKRTAREQHPSWTCTTTIGLRVIPLDDMPSTALTPLIDHPSVFEVLNLFRACWFLNCKHLMSLTLAAVKGGNNNDITWIDLLPSSHTHLLCQAKNLAPPSYPLPLLKRVMFTFLLEVINSQGCNLNQFIKTLAPHRCCAPTPAPSPPPVVGPSALAVGLLASLVAGLQVPDTRTQHSGIDMPVTPMVVDPAPPPSAPPPPNWDLSALTLFDWTLLATHGLVAFNEAHSISGESPFIPKVLLSPGARPEKRGFLPPACPTSPPPPIGTPLARAPPDWRAWITQRCWTNMGTSNRALGSNSPISFFDLSN